jgi:putative transcriptional regulator
MARYHPSEDWLTAYASGAGDEASSVLIATHLTFCSDCRKAVRKLEAIGGALLDDMDIEELENLPDAPQNPAVSRPVLNAEENETDPAAYTQGTFSDIAPRPLLRYVFDRLGAKDIDALPWKFYGPGVKRAVLLQTPNGASVRLLRSRPGAAFPAHRHGSEELTLVLKGAYRDGADRYQTGDVQCASETVAHQPIVEQGGECIALVVSEKPTIPLGIVARIVQRIIGA